MAISKDTWDRAKAYFEAGKSLTYIVDKTGISKSQLSKRSKADEWIKNKTKQIKDDIIELQEEKETLKRKNETVMKQLFKLEDYEIEVIGDLIEDEAEIKSLLFNTTALNIVRVNQDLKHNVKSEKLNSGDGIQTLEPVKLSSADYKNHQDTLDKASITLGINKRHAPKAEINNTNGQQNNNGVEIVGYKVRTIE